MLQGDAQAEAAVGPVRAALFHAVKALENALPVFRGNAGAVIFDDERDFAAQPRCAEFYMSACRRIAHSVIHQCIHRSLQHGLVALNQRQRFFGGCGAQLNALLRRWGGMALHRPVEERAGLYRISLRHPFGRGGQQQQVLGKLAHVG